MRRASHILVTGDGGCVGASCISGKWTTPRGNCCGTSVDTLEHKHMCTNGHVPVMQDPPHGAHVV
jgi:hypothetical protein